MPIRDVESRSYPSSTSLAAYDVLGREVARLVEGEVEAGYHRAVFDAPVPSVVEASGLPAGVYVYRLEAGEYVESRRMVVAK